MSLYLTFNEAAAYAAESQELIIFLQRKLKTFNEAAAYAAESRFLLHFIYLIG